MQMRISRWKLWKTLCLALLLIPALIAAQLSSVRADALPDTAYIPGVVGHAQRYSLSCESRSAADWTAFWGQSAGEQTILDSLPRSDNPNKGFVGQPDDPWGNIPPAGYGVHAEPVAQALRQLGFTAEARRGLAWDDLRAEIAAGRPVIVWVIGQMWGGRAFEYTASDGDTITVARFEHTVILIGYDLNTVHVVDAYSGWTTSYSLAVFLASWQVLGNMAVTGWLDATLEDDESPDAAVSASDRAYIVQKGEYLKLLADRFGVDWQTLAALNGIGYPYMIYPGQELQLPALAQNEPIGAVSQENTLDEETQTLPLEMTWQSYLPLIQAAAPAAVEELVAQEPAVIELSDPAALPSAISAQAIVYIVQPGDRLTWIARQFHLTGLELAFLNRLEDPFSLYPGQVLRLK